MPERGIYFERPSWATVTSWADELAGETRL
jgi:hypothetical protein